MKDTDYLGNDKLKHLIVCLIISVISPQAALGAALGKEYGDSKAYNNHWCWWDLLYDIIGIILGGIVHFITFKSL